MARTLKQPSETIDVPMLTPGFRPASVLSTTVEPRGRVPQLTPLVVASSLAAADGAVVRLVGGTDGERYLVSVRLQAADGERREAEAEVAVADLSWSDLDLSTPYASLTDFVERVGLERTIELTDEDGTGRIDRARLAAVLADAGATIDSYLARRVAVPVSPVPPALRAAAIALAQAALHRSALPEGVKRAADDAARLLRDIADGRVLPAGLAEATAPSSSDAPQLLGSDRLFSRQTLRGW